MGRGESAAPRKSPVVWAHLSKCGRSRTQPLAAERAIGSLGPSSLPARSAAWAQPLLAPRHKGYGSADTRLATGESIDGCRRMPDRRPGCYTGSCSAPGFRVPWIRPSLTVDTPSPRVRSLVRVRSVDPGPRVQCPVSIRVMGTVLWSVWVPSTRSLTRPSSDRSADCPDFARAACIHLHAAKLGAGGRSQRGGPVAVREVDIWEMGP